MDEIVETYRLIPTEGEGLLRNSHLEMLYATVRHFNGGISLKEQYGKDALIEIEEYRKELVEADIADTRERNTFDGLENGRQKVRGKVWKEEKENLYIQL